MARPPAPCQAYAHRPGSPPLGDSADHLTRPHPISAGVCRTMRPGTYHPEQFKKSFPEKVLMQPSSKKKEITYCTKIVPFIEGWIEQ